MKGMNSAHANDRLAELIIKIEDYLDIEHRFDLQKELIEYIKKEAESWKTISFFVTMGGGYSYILVFYTFFDFNNLFFTLTFLGTKCVKKLKMSPIMKIQ